MRWIHLTVIECLRKNLFPDEKFSTVLESINQFNEIFKQKEIKFRDNVYSNLLTTKTFISDNKSELKNINNFLYE